MFRPDRPFHAAATRFLRENQHKRTICEDARLLKRLDPHVGTLSLRKVHMGSLQPFIAKRRSEGVKSRSINNSLALIRHILNLAASEWRDEQGLTWLESAPKIRLFPVRDGRAPYPLSRAEQDMLFQELPQHLARMALFKVNTGCRDREVCGLKWDDEVKVPELDTSVFIIPGDRVKNAQDRLVVLNRIARSVVEAQRGRHPEYVFALRAEATQGQGRRGPGSAEASTCVPHEQLGVAERARAGSRQVGKANRGTGAGWVSESARA